MESLPDIVRREIIGPKLCEKEVGYNDRKEATARIITMLGVNFSDEEQRKIAMSEFRTFLREWKLTKDEVIEAYRMAIKKQLQKELLDFKGKPTGTAPIQVFPNLSIIQAGEILNAYQEHKISSSEHSVGIKTLKKLMGRDDKASELTPEMVDRDKFFELVFDEMKQSGTCWMAFTLFDELEASGKIKIPNAVKKRLFNILMTSHKNGLAKEIIGRTGKTRKVAELDVMAMFSKTDLETVIKRKCQAISVCNYLKKHLQDYDTFKAAIHG
jgi:hypothetical protein